jgi:hypothetical protein
MTMKNFEGKYVFLKIYPNTIYTGIIREVNFVGYDNNGEPIYLIEMIDKFGKRVAFNSNEIKFIEEQNVKLGDK